MSGGGGVNEKQGTIIAITQSYKFDRLILLQKTKFKTMILAQSPHTSDGNEMLLLS